MKCSVVLAGVAATTAMAEDGASSSSVNGAFRGAVTHSDNGYDGEDAVASTTIAPEYAKLMFSGDVNSKTNFKMRLNVAGDASLDYYHMTTKYGPVKVSLGKLPVLQGGWDYNGSALKRMASGAYMSKGSYTSGDATVNYNNMARSKFEEGVTLAFDVAGTVKLQFLNDVPNGNWNQSVHPTFAIGWTGKFGPIEPKINYGTQDNQHSSWMDVGFKTSMSGLTASLDYGTVTTNAKGVDPDDAEKSMDNESVSTAITLKASYALKGTATPFFYYSSFDNEQYTADGADQVVINSSSARTDNGTTIGFGSSLDMLASKNFTPYFKVVMNSGDWQDADEEANTGETLTNTDISVGVYASM
jgi:hypothetical protein